jgi:hypothetical protein
LLLFWERLPIDKLLGRKVSTSQQLPESEEEKDYRKYLIKQEKLAHKELSKNVKKSTSPGTSSAPTSQSP